MSFLSHANNAASTLAGACASGATTLTIQPGDTGLFPASGNFEVTMWPAGQNPTAANSEIVLVTAGQSTATFTITRAQEGTSAKNFSTSDNVALLMTKKLLTDIETLFPTGTVVGTTDTQTLSAKRITKRVVAVTQSATPAINSDNMDVASITALAQAVTSFTTNLTGTPNNGDLLEIQITDNGSPRALTFGASFVATTVALPTTTVTSTLLRVLFQWDTTASKWGCVAVA